MPRRHGSDDPRWAWAAPDPVPGTDRRVGKRVETPRLPVKIRYVVPASRWWQSNVDCAADGYVADMSMTGVGLFIPRNVALPIGSVVTVEIRGATGQMIVRGARNVDDFWAQYGFEYCALEGDFHELVSQLVAGTHIEFDWQWNIAR
jgi:hypothetical protein